MRLVGHGSSDNAASYGVYAFGLLPGWTAMRDSMSLTIYYGAGRLRAVGRRRALAVRADARRRRVRRPGPQARRARRALTNAPSSSSATRPTSSCPWRPGPEHAVAATKTYVNQLVALALLAGCAAGGRNGVASGLQRVADQMTGAIPGLAAAVAAPANAFAFVGRMFVIGRGLEFATAREVALKLKGRVGSPPSRSRRPTSSMARSPRSIRSFPCGRSHRATMPSPRCSKRVPECDRQARRSWPVETQRPSQDPAYTLAVPEPALPVLAPLLSVVPGQLFAGALARAKRFDPDKPVGLSKVTLAR